MALRDEHGRFVKGHEATYQPSVGHDKGVSHKSHPAWNKGLKGTGGGNKPGWHHTEEAKTRIAKSSAGRRHTEEAKEKIRQAQLGHPKYKGSGSPKGTHSSPATEFKNGLTPWNKGKKGLMPEPWNKGMGDQSARDRELYKTWRKSVYERDDFTCKDCGHRGGRIHAHHISMWRDYPELRYELENGVTLCVPCHRKRHYQREVA